MSTPSIAPQENLQTVPWQTLQVGKLIGQGGYSEVYQGQWNGREVAIKQLLLKKLPDHLVKDFDNETRIMAQVAKCAQIVKLLGVCMEEGHYAMVMEYMPRGSLYQVLQDAKVNLPWQPLRLQLAIDIGKGLSYLHDREILHRDLKSLNILLDNNFNAKITDFGLSKIKLETKSTSTLHKQSAGTVRWRAPELFRRNVQHSKASDVYSYGMILWEIASRKLPFSDADDDLTVISWINVGEQETIPEGAPSEYGKLISQAWSKEPEKRPSSQYIVLQVGKLLPKPAAKSWHFDPESKVMAEGLGKEYALIEATAKDVDKVQRFYSHHPVPGYEIGSVKIVYNPTFNRSFESHMKKLQARHGNAFFDAKWSWNLLDKHLDWRQKVQEMFEEMAKPYTDPDYPNVKLLPLWHGTATGAVESICKVGYANPTSIDSGFFGRGLYGAHEAEYPYRVYCKGAFFLNWVAIYSAYPVVLGDQGKLEAKGNFENYDAHFIPVSPRDPNNPIEHNYDPCPPFAQHTYTEVVVFESAACLPRYLVELQPILTKQVKFTPAVPPRPTSRTLPSLPPPPSASPKPFSPILPTGTSSKPSVSSAPSTPEEQFKHGLKYFSGEGVQKDFSVSFKCFQLAADKGHSEAQFYLGISYLHGEGCKIDKKMAVKYFQLAADQGHVLALRRLGQCFKEGWGVKKDEEMGNKYIQKAVAQKLIQYLKIKADQGDAFFQHELGICYYFGDGVAQDYKMAVKYYQLAADQGDALAQYNLGFCYKNGQGVAQDDKMAVKYYQLAADQGNALAQCFLGFCYDNGQGVAQDYKMAVKYFQLAADQGNASARSSLGFCYYNGQGVAQDYKMAVKYFQLAADQGDALAQYNLGVCYDNGQGVAKDDKIAVKYYQLAADQGDASAQYYLGVCYDNGQGVAKDDKMAVKYYQLAADQGNALAQCFLGFCYDNGQGVAQDYKMAVKYFQLAADQGNATAQYNLGVCYYNGQGVAQDYKMAVKYFQLAADQGYASAQFYLGFCYEKGQGVNKDVGEAVKYYKLASEQGDQNAKEALGRLTS